VQDGASLEKSKNVAGHSSSAIGTGKCGCEWEKGSFEDGKKNAHGIKKKRGLFARRKRVSPNSRAMKIKKKRGEWG